MATTIFIAIAIIAFLCIFTAILFELFEKREDISDILAKVAFCLMSILCIVTVLYLLTLLFQNQCIFLE